MKKILPISIILIAAAIFSTVYFYSFLNLYVAHGIAVLACIFYTVAMLGLAFAVPGPEQYLTF